MVEKNDFVELAVMFSVYGWMIASGIIFKRQPEIATISQFASMGLMMVFIIVKEAWARVEASKYIYAPTTIRPYNKKYDLYIQKQSEGGWVSKRVPHVPNLFISMLPLGRKVDKLGSYDDVTKIGIVHQFTLNDRLNPHDGKCNWLGNIVPHAQVTELTLYEENPEDIGSEFSAPVPVFTLREAPGDFNIPELRAVEVTPIPKGSLSNKKVEEFIVKQYRTLQKKTSQVNTLETRVATKTQQASYWHTLYNQLYAYAKQLKEEISGLQKNLPNFMTEVISHADSTTHDLDDIYDLANGDDWLHNLDWKWATILIVGTVGILSVALNEKMRTQILTYLGDNQLIAAILVIGVIAAGYYLFKNYIRRK